MMQVNEAVKTKGTGDGKVSSLLDCYAKGVTMNWVKSDICPSDKQEIIIKAKDANGEWRYAIGVWSKERMFTTPDISCPECGARPLFMNNGLIGIGLQTKREWQWLPLSKFLQLELRVDHLTFEKDRLYDRCLRNEEIMYDAVLSEDYDELQTFVRDKLDA